MALQIEIIAIFAAVEQKTWEVAQRLKGKVFGGALTRTAFLFSVFLAVLSRFLSEVI